MKQRAFFWYACKKCSAVIASDLATPSRMAMLGTTMMNLLQPCSLFSSKMVLM